MLIFFLEQLTKHCSISFFVKCKFLLHSTYAYIVRANISTDKSRDWYRTYRGIVQMAQQTIYWVKKNIFLRNFYAFRDAFYSPLHQWVLTQIIFNDDILLISIVISKDKVLVDVMNITLSIYFEIMNHLKAFYYRFL